MGAERASGGPGVSRGQTMAEAGAELNRALRGLADVVIERLEWALLALVEALNRWACRITTHRKSDQ